MVGAFCPFFGLAIAKLHKKDGKTTIIVCFFVINRYLLVLNVKKIYIISVSQQLFVILHAIMETEEKAYSKRINRKTLDDIRKGIHNYVIVGRRYRDINYTAKRLAEDIDTNTRYLSAAIRLHYGCNFAELVNRLRVDDAKQMIGNPDCSMSMEDIAYSAGFANRQSFYTAFARYVGIKPTAYRQRIIDSRNSAFEVLSFD